MYCYVARNINSRYRYVIAICKARDGVERGCGVAMRCRCATKGVGVDDTTAIHRMGMDKKCTTTHIETYDE